METFSAFLPIRRRLALAAGESLPDRVIGSALFADISGFTPLTNTLAQELGHRRGAEEVIHHLNRVYTALIDRVHHFGGDVINFSGDAITCWFDEPTAAARSVACGLALQDLMSGLQAITTPAGTVIPLAVKVAIAAGPARRFLVGDPDAYVIEVLAGATLDRMAAAEKHAERGEVVVSAEVPAGLPDVAVAAWREDGPARFALVAGMAGVAGVGPDTRPAEEISGIESPELDIETTRPWLLPPVYDHLLQATDEFLAELRPAVSLFARFSGIDYDGDDAAGDKLNDFISQAQAIFNHYDGYLLQLTMGDKGSYLYASFGAPIAHEDDTARAATAALALRELPHSFPYIQPLQIGISRGQTHSGAYGSPQRRTYGVLGSDVNISARLMTTARPGQILVSPAVAAGLGDEFELSALPPVNLKGTEGPFAIWELHRRLATFSPVARPRTVRDQDSLMVGREAERAILADVLGELAAGQSSNLIIEGVAGIGKSLLARELLSMAQAGETVAPFILLGAGDAIEQSTAYFAWRPIFERLFDPAGSGLFDAESVLARLDPESQWMAPLLNPVLSFNLPENELTEQMRGEARQDATQELMVQLLQTFVSGQSLLLVIDEAHWLDSLSWTLLRRVQRELHPLLLVVVARPMGGEEPLIYGELSAHPSTRRMVLDTLPDAAVEELVRRRLGVRRLPRPVLDFIRQKAEGHPFFSEELALALRDAGYLEMAGDEVRLAAGVDDLSALNFPDTIQGIITSRIDRLPAEQQLTVKVASVIGRIFAFRVLRDIYPIRDQESQLYHNLEGLERRDITLPETPEPNLSYVFKHIVAHEVVYSLMTFAQRNQLHHATALWYEQAGADDPGRYPLLAYHWQQAGDTERAVEYYGRAGENAFRDFANREAIRFLQQAAMLGTGRPAVDRARWHRIIGEASYRLTLMEQSRTHYETSLALLGRPLPASRLRQGLGLIGEFIRQVRHRRLSGRTGRRTLEEQDRLLEAARALEGVGEVYYNEGDAIGSFYSVMSALNLAEEAGPSPELMRGYANMCATLGIASLHGMADGYRERTLVLAEEIEDKSAVAWIYIPLSTYSLWIGAWDRAEGEIAEALQIYARLREWRHWGVAAWLLPQVAQSKGEIDRAEELWAAHAAMADRHEDSRHQVRNRGGRFFSLVSLGRFKEAFDVRDEVAALLVENPEMEPIEERLWLAMNATAAFHEEDPDRAKILVHNQIDAIERSQFKFDLLDVFAAPSEILLGLCERGEASPGEVPAGLAVLKGYARSYAFARPRMLRLTGRHALLAGNPGHAERAFRKSLGMADKLAMTAEWGQTAALMAAAGIKPAARD
jgi:class 3 adenylate cyclase/tetratricopeptide (TPR) repeat protein